MDHYNIWMQILFILTLPAWTPNTTSSKISGNRCCEINKTLKPTRHRTDLLFKSLGDSVGIFYGAPVMSLVRICHFKFVGASVDILNGESVPSHVRVTRFESVGDSVVKITRQNLHVSYPPFFH